MVRAVGGMGLLIAGSSGGGDGKPATGTVKRAGSGVIG